MSGQLVGEVIAASDSLRSGGLSVRGFQALIAIAEKAITQTRQGSVRWDHIRAAQYGTSLATAKRAVKELEDAGYIRKVKRGFNNQNGRSAAPIYELVRDYLSAGQQADATPSREVPNGSPMMTQSPATERLTHDDPIASSLGQAPGPNGSHKGGEWVKSETEWVIQGELLDGLTPDVPTSDKGALLRFGGTSPGADGFAQSITKAYEAADMSRECPNCRAEPNDWCRHPDGTPKRVPCLVRNGVHAR